MLIVDADPDPRDLATQILFVAKTELVGDGLRHGFSVSQRPAYRVTCQAAAMRFSMPLYNVAAEASRSSAALYAANQRPPSCAEACDHCA
jgi:hypothetical protein